LAHDNRNRATLDFLAQVLARIWAYLFAPLSVASLADAGGSETDMGAADICDEAVIGRGHVFKYGKSKQQRRPKAPFLS
jgi:hypothetical protein